MNKLSTGMVRPDQVEPRNAVLSLTSIAVWMLAGPPLAVWVLALLDVSSGHEGRAVVLSTFVASAFWLAFVRVVARRSFARRFVLLLTALLAVRLALNFGHFYLVFAPLAGIDSSASLGVADFAGDLGVIYDASLRFLGTLESSGVNQALFGDYYRAFNNPGVPVVYGSLFRAFGPFGAVAVPWALLYSGFASLITVQIASRIGLEERTARAAGVIVVLLPGLLVFPPVYRDVFIVSLVLMSAYVALRVTPRGYGLAEVSMMVALSGLLGVLRAPYAVLPLLFGLGSSWLFSATLSHRHRRVVRARLLLIVVASLAVALLLVPGLVNETIERIGRPYSSNQSDFAVLQGFKQLGPLTFYPAAAVFSVLAPMPWWQAAPTSILAYQVFAYAQVLTSMVFLLGVIHAAVQRVLHKGEKVMVYNAAVVWALAVLGSSNLGYSYVMIASPLLLLASVRLVALRPAGYILGAGSIIAAAHVALLVV